MLLDQISHESRDGIKEGRFVLREEGKAASEGARSHERRCRRKDPNTYTKEILGGRTEKTPDKTERQALQAKPTRALASGAREKGLIQR